MRPTTQETPLTAPLASTIRRAERERQLRSDPHVEVLSPEEVRCKLCSQFIKLSKKSAYDMYHWETHRKRCLIRQQRLKRSRETDVDDVPAQKRQRMARKENVKVRPPPPTRRVSARRAPALVRSMSSESTLSADGSVASSASNPPPLTPDRESSPPAALAPPVTRSTARHQSQSHKPAHANTDPPCPPALSASKGKQKQCQDDDASLNEASPETEPFLATRGTGASLACSEYLRSVTSEVAAAAECRWTYSQLRSTLYPADGDYGDFKLRPAEWQ